MSLTPQQERFAQGCVELVNQSAAYRQAYNVGPDTNFRTISVEASRLAADPEIAARIRELQDAAAMRSGVPSLATRIQELRAMETANPNDIIGMRWVNCRRCRGEGHQHQWKDEREWAMAMDEALKAHQKTLPDAGGGFGFHPYLDPVADCPGCYGVGEQRPWIADTSKLTGGARLLYKAIKVKGNGDIEILLHDQMQARDMLNRIMGAYKDGVNNIPQAPPSAAAVAQTQKTPEERQRSYLRMVSG
jgi:hypothetical protein